jgi:transposase
MTALDATFSALIQEDVKDLRLREKATSNKRITDRLRFLRFLKEGQGLLLEEAAQILGYPVRTVPRWWPRYRHGGLSALLPTPRRRGARERITPDAWAGLEAEMRAGRIGSLGEAQASLRTPLCAPDGRSTTALMPSPNCFSGARPK